MYAYAYAYDNAQLFQFQLSEREYFTLIYVSNQQSVQYKVSQIMDNSYWISISYEYLLEEHQLKNWSPKSVSTLELNLRHRASDQFQFRKP
jgi:hypothetical protein